MKTLLLFLALLVTLGFILATFLAPNFWSTPEQRGDALMQKHNYALAAATYKEPWKIGIALYRNGDFEAAAKMFARVSGPEGYFDQANSWLMHGAYEKAIETYTEALKLRPGWKEAEDNLAIARARKQAIDQAGDHREEEATDAYTPDKIVMDGKGKKSPEEPNKQGDGNQTDSALREQWLRKVQTTPGDFLKAKFAWQASHQGETP